MGFNSGFKGLIEDREFQTLKSYKTGFVQQTTCRVIFKMMCPHLLRSMKHMEFESQDVIFVLSATSRNRKCVCVCVDHDEPLESATCSACNHFRFLSYHLHLFVHRAPKYRCPKSVIASPSIFINAKFQTKPSG